MRETGLSLTGERTLPGIPHENYWFRRHEVVYAACLRWYAASARPEDDAQGECAPTLPRAVLDAGCGEGYGAALLSRPGARGTPSVVGVDYDAATTAHARSAHGGQRTAYVRGALTALPLADAAVDLAVSLQVIEHLWSPGDYVGELVRVTRPGGVVVLSTPNRLTFSPGLGRRGHPVNPFHSREYDAAELVGELGRWAPQCQAAEVLGVRHGPRLREWERRNGSLVTAQLGSTPDRWDPRLAALVAGVGTGDFEVAAADVNGGLDLVVVLRRGASTPRPDRRAPRNATHHEAQSQP